MIHFDKGTLFQLNQTLETSFSKIEGRFELLPFISKYFNIYYPMFIFIVCLVALLGLVTRCISIFGCVNLFLNSECSDDQVSEGRLILQREKNKRAITDGLTDELYLSSGLQPLVYISIFLYSASI
uniref:LMBR1 domain-containing protein 2 (Trinotate prediction) n=1 Tax=Henneguya salminicola TaxID=69463 RepID=A0A6G3MFC0_HENSL